MNPHDEIYNLPTSMRDFEDMDIEIYKYLSISYGMKVDKNDIPTAIDQNHIPTVSIQRVINPDNTENLDSDLQPKKKMKKQTAKVERLKKSTIGNKTNQINNSDIPINQMGLDHQDVIDHNDIPTVIDRWIIPENSDKQKMKKPTRKVGIRKKSTIGIKRKANHDFSRDENVVDEIYHKYSVVNSAQMSNDIEKCLSINEYFIPTVIESVIINNDSDKNKKSIKKGRHKGNLLNMYN